MKCFCLSGAPYTSCCQPIIKQQKKPESPEALMRSRYSAFCLGDVDYLVCTHWPIEQSNKLKIQQTIDNTQWCGLKIIESQTASRSEGEVEFVAFFEENGVQQLHERSYFRKIAQQWFYISGEHLPPIKLQRNYSCFCGSGKKYKKCHG